MDVRQKSKADLLSQLKDLKAGLAHLRVGWRTGGPLDPRRKIQLVRVSISQVLTDLAKAEEERQSDTAHLAAPPETPT